MRFLVSFHDMSEVDSSKLIDFLIQHLSPRNMSSTGFLFIWFRKRDKTPTIFFYPPTSIHLNKPFLGILNRGEINATSWVTISHQRISCSGRTQPQRFPSSGHTLLTQWEPKRNFITRMPSTHAMSAIRSKRNHFIHFNLHLIEAWFDTIIG
jgi:hypothetical protein